MISSKIVKEYGYLSHNGKIIEVDDEQVMIFTKSDPGTFNMTYDERETKKNDTTVSINPITKYKTIANFLAKLDPRGVNCPKKKQEVTASP